MKIARAPVMSGLSIPASLRKKFVRPSLKRKAYDKRADELLATRSLGQKKRFGMAKLLGRKFIAPGGFNPTKPERNSDSDASSEEEEEERPFEPLVLWVSPAEGGECIVRPSEARAKQHTMRGSMMTYKTPTTSTIMRVAGSATSAMRKPQTPKRVRNDEA
jgi:hypothetical protein